MKNSPATFQRLINTIIAGIEHCEAYIDDAIIYSDEWNHHMGTIKAFFDKLSETKLTINLAKSEFCHATKAVVPMLVLLFVVLWFILRGDLLYVFPRVILFLCFQSF